MRDFFKYTLATVLGLLIFMGLSIGGLLSLIISAAMRDPEPSVKDQSVLVFNLSTEITDAKRSSDRIVEEALTGSSSNSITLREVLDAIDTAAKDKRIVGLYLHGNLDNASGGSGFATLREVRKALENFRKTGKKVIAYEMGWREQDYYLGSVADTVVLNPSGIFEINGFASQATFFAGALQKFGVGVQVTRVGKYKSAVEPFTLSQRSPANQQQTRQLLSDLWSEFLQAASQSRIAKNSKLTPQQLQTISDTSAFLSAEEARQQGLVDKVAYLDEVLAELKQLTGEEDSDKPFRQVDLSTYAKTATAERSRNSNNKIAVIYAEGEIVSGQGSSGQIGGDRFAKQLRQLRLDDDVKAVVLRVNSPGGSATASDVIQREVILTRKVKPVIVSMGSIAASGGYWIATYGDRIFAEPTTITGSIGVFGLLPNVQKLANDNGITWDTVKTGRYADIDTISRPKTPQEMQIFQKNVDRIYDAFIQKVAESRKLPKPKVAEIAQGRVWSGIQAKKLGLVDQLGGLDDAIREAVQRAKVGDDWQLVEHPKVRSLSERLLENLGGDQIAEGSTNDPFVQELLKFKADLDSLRAMNDPLGVYIRLPFNIRID